MKQDKSRKRGVRACRIKLQKALSESDLDRKTQVALANRIADEEELDAAPKDLVNKIFRQYPVDPQSLERVARALRVDAQNLYLEGDSFRPSVPPEYGDPHPLQDQKGALKNIILHPLSLVLAFLLLSAFTYWHIIAGRPAIMCQINESLHPLKTAPNRLGIVIGRFANDPENIGQRRLTASFLNDPKLSPYISVLQSCDRPSLTVPGDITARLHEIRQKGQEKLARSSAHILLWGQLNGQNLQIRFISTREDTGPVTFDIKGKPTQISETYLEIPLSLDQPETTLPDIKRAVLELISTKTPALQETRRNAMHSYKTSLDWLRASILSDRNVKRSINPKTDPQLWALINGQLCYRQRLLGDFDSDVTLYREAEQSCRDALDVRARKDFPRDWATLKINHSAVLTRLHLYAESPATSREYLYQAENLLHQAGEVVERQSMPQLWALQQRNLGAVFMRLGELSNGDEAETYFNRGLETMQAALTVLRPEYQPVDWAMTQQNICGSLYRKGYNQGKEGIALVQLAIDHCTEALRWLDPKQSPLTWAMVQNNLAVSKAIFSQLEQKPDKLVQAISDFKEAQRIYTRKDFPANWAEVEINLGELTCNLARLRKDPTQLDRAIAHAEQALEVVMQKKLNRYQRYLEGQLKNYKACQSLEMDACKCSPS
ncbi:hypothetical protein [Paremcibacter congregatus]|uniref:HTH cro/C1-type domain-containing protein n=1 Tax=Paremcibacter congregatus TaxID=2043170 RepID=A0A2G4YSK8_9PROT|nr:hypothetical protein [Paremcibacter congregatus]PHZ85247.1 hypothetical protein CRD36_07525 [Paremcibacter congregatus]QDE27821.1 hypothetical protein FIV45_11310 [Paremcibacter congregatus]